MTPARGLQPFLLGMISAPPEALAWSAANPDRVARHHGIPVEWVRFNLQFWGVPK